MTAVVSALPTVVQPRLHGQPEAFVWHNRLSWVTRILRRWESHAGARTHWDVATLCGQRVTLAYDRAKNGWFIEGVNN